MFFLFFSFFANEGTSPDFPGSVYTFYVLTLTSSNYTILHGLYLIVILENYCIIHSSLMEWIEQVPFSLLEHFHR